MAFLEAGDKQTTLARLVVEQSVPDQNELPNKIASYSALLNTSVVFESVLVIDRIERYQPLHSLGHDPAAHLGHRFRPHRLSGLFFI